MLGVAMVVMQKSASSLFKIIPVWSEYTKEPNLQGGKVKPLSAQDSPVVDDINCTWHPVNHFCVLPACKCSSEDIQKEFVLLLVTEISSLLLVPVGICSTHRNSARGSASSCILLNYDSPWS